MDLKMARTPIHPGEIRAEELGELGASRTELSRQIRVPANRVSQIINGKRAITGDTASRALVRHESAVLDEPAGALRCAAG
jgi:addiction module HigA family antidote